MAEGYTSVPHQYLEEMEMLNDAEFGRLMRHLLIYSATGEITSLSGPERFFSNRVRLQEDMSARSYAEKAKARSEAAKKAAAARWEPCERIEKDANACERINRNANYAIKESKVKESKVKNINPPISPLREDANAKAKKKPVDPFAAFAGEDKVLADTLKAFEDMRKKIKKPMTERAKELLIMELKKNYNSSEWIAVLEQSIVNCWQGIFPLKKNNLQQQTRQNASTQSAMQENIKKFMEEF